MAAGAAGALVWAALSVLFSEVGHHSNDATCPLPEVARDGIPRPAATGPVIRASCTARLDSLTFESSMDWMRVRRYVRGTPWQDRPLCRTPSEVQLRLSDTILRLTPIGDVNGGKSCVRASSGGVALIWCAHVAC